jgi:hypothetical protein
LESRTIIEVGSNKEAIIVKEGQADDKMGKADLPTLLRAKPARQERYINKYIALV